MKKILKTVIASTNVMSAWQSRRYMCSPGLLRHFVPRNDVVLRLLTVMCFVMFLGLSTFAAEKVQVTLSRVYDGDTIEVINENNQKENIRLKGIDCFETSEINRAYKQAYQNKMTIEEVTAKGVQQKKALIKLFEDNSKKHLYLVRCGKDVYKRTLGIIYLGNLNINQYMLKSGNAMEYIYIKK